MQDVTIAGNWVKGVQDYSVLYLTIICKYTIISKQKYYSKKILEKKSNKANFI